MQFSYHIEGMHCTACVEKIKSVLSPDYKIKAITLEPPLLTIEAEESPLLGDLNNRLASRGNYRLHPTHTAPPASDADAKTGVLAYYPLFLITAYLIGVASLNNMDWPIINWQGWMNQFMAGFFLVFSAFKLLDIRGFAEGYSTYDLLAKRWFTYGYLYPFLELGLGILYLTQKIPLFTHLATIILMGFSSLGVINSLLKKQRFQCACLGTFLKVPLSQVTLIEDLTMVFMAAIGLGMHF